MVNTSTHKGGNLQNELTKFAVPAGLIVAKNALEKYMDKSNKSDGLLTSAKSSIEKYVKKMTAPLTKGGGSKAPVAKGGKMAAKPAKKGGAKKTYKK